MKKPVIIIGGGGHARVLLDALRLNDISILGFTDPNTASSSFSVLGVPFLGGDTSILQFNPMEVELVNAVGSVGSTELRKQIYLKFRSKGYSFATVIHPSAIISQDTSLSDGVQVMAGAIIQAGCRVGSNTIINTRASVDHDCILSDHVHVAPGAILSGNVQLCKGVHVGCGATIIQQICVNENSIVGAGAVVLRDVDANRTVIGIPAKEVLT